MWNKLSYHKKNKLLYTVAAVVFVICWIFAFSKTWDAYSLNNRLEQQIGTGTDNSKGSKNMIVKSRVLDSLVSRYRKDSLQWNDNFIMNASKGMTDPAINLSYNNASSGKRSNDADTLALRKTIMVSGTYKGLVQQIQALEALPELGLLSRVILKTKDSRYDQDAATIQTELEFRVVR
ncbi:hypothetical protein U0038_06675 [Sphingobacterium spiritivorum]|uniref:Uncharacterized protein n=1 Tax=Sphingobacterium spiritivorum ATCC 33861 TaxID=525373 RepID=D7VLT5_SPHSI|nr:hypothetical protein [Sphingobacterium spiritivorum]EFK58197.1 hypothetical protein HMPREF0766_12189 [Sphingobacterium spiritivorum ATCC 33861]QQT34556.1 hypothetical protein I6J01_14735 [Sphingobacterium spiritivorum]WQD35429.1 hypothetical protein U0038_06675 [Sphingobacterium spiritivorum]SUJ00364.1 Uncharacterised protein [Sphingobacterium spiritivorum]